MNIEELGYDPDQQGVWLVLKAGIHSYITGMEDTKESSEQAWREIYESLLLLPVEAWPRVEVQEHWDRTPRKALELAPNGPSWVAAEILYMMDRYHVKVPHKGFIRSDFGHYQGYAFQHNLPEGLQPASVYRCQVGQPIVEPPAEGGTWQLLDTSGAVQATAKQVWDLEPVGGWGSSSATRLVYGLPGESTAWVQTTPTELLFIRAFQEAQPTQKEGWFKSLVEQQALDAFIASHYGAYQAFALVQGLPIGVREELKELIEEAEYERGNQSYTVNLEGYKQALASGAPSEVEQQLAFMRQYGIPGEQEFVHALGDPDNRQRVSQAYLDNHRVEILLAQPVRITPERAISVNLLELHEAVVQRPELLYTSVVRQSDLESLYFWIPLMDFDREDWPALRRLVPESLLNNPRFQLEALAVGMYTEEELEGRLMPKLAGVGKSRTNYLQFSQAERVSGSYPYWADAIVICDPRCFGLVPEAERTPIQVEQLLLRDWSELSKVSPDLLDKLAWSEEMVLSGFRRQVGSCHDLDCMERLFASLPERYHTPRVRQVMDEALQRFGKVAEARTEEQTAQRKRHRGR